PPSLGNDPVHPAAHSKQFRRDMTHTLRLIPATTQKQPDGCFFDERKKPGFSKPGLFWGGKTTP
ncbi:MAG: hypothetical protein IJ198_02835, partial [Lachnospiraceae bacterium]|nr:hypothetical protein [Lachnospiraceae bacterium]